MYKIIKKILKHKHHQMDQMVLLKVKKNLMVYHLSVKKKNKQKKKKKKKNMLKLKKKNMLKQKKKVIKKNIMKNKYLKKIVQEVKKMILSKINKMLIQLNNYHLKLKKNKLNYKVITKMMIKIQMIIKIVQVKNQTLYIIVSNIKKIQKM